MGGGTRELTGGPCSEGGGKQLKVLNRMVM